MKGTPIRDRKIRFALVGCGRISANHLGAMERHAEQRYQIQVQRDLTRNFVAHLAHGMLGQTGFRLIQAPTFVEAFVVSLGVTKCFTECFAEWNSEWKPPCRA